MAASFPIPSLCRLPAQGGAEGQRLSYWAGTFFSADEVRQGWPLADRSPPCIPVLSQAQLGRSSFIAPITDLREPGEFSEM